MTYRDSSIWCDGATSIGRFISTRACPLGLLIHRDDDDSMQRARIYLF